jgi:hypothetical protein
MIEVATRFSDELSSVHAAHVNACRLSFLHAIRLTLLVTSTGTAR